MCQNLVCTQPVVEEVEKVPLVQRCGGYGEGFLFVQAFASGVPDELLYYVVEVVGSQPGLSSIVP